MVVYVDDLILVSENRAELENLKTALKKNFEMKDLGKVSRYLGINVNRTEGKLELDQKDYLQEILNKYNMENCKPVATPIEVGLDIPKESANNEELTKRCRRLIGRLMYAMLGTRPDLCFAMSFLSRYQANANEELWKALKRVLRYIKGSLDLKLTYNAHEHRPVLIGYTDADWAGDKEDRKSTSGYLMQVFGCTVSWSSSKQQCVSLSTTESEYIALGRGVSEGCWIRILLQEIGIGCLKVIIMVDNQSAICIAKNPEKHSRVKHIDIKYHFVRNKVCDKVLELKYIPTDEQLADLCTKGLSKFVFERLRNKVICD